MKRMKKATNYVLLTLAVIIIFSPLAKAAGGGSCVQGCVNFLDQFCTGGIFLFAACHATHVLGCGLLCALV